jgi:predicted Zn-dependent protease
MRGVLFLVAVSATVAQPQSGAGINFYSVEKEIQLGNQLAASMQANTHAQPDARLQSIGDKLAMNAAGAYQYRFSIYAADGKPAEPVAVPGGPVFTAQGLVSSHDAKTAAPLAHAIAHIALRTDTPQAIRFDLLNIGRQSAEKAGIRSNGVVNGQSFDSQKAAIAQWFESEADVYAVKILFAAGYDPRFLVEWLQSLPASEARNPGSGIDLRAHSKHQAGCVRPPGLLRGCDREAAGATEGAVAGEGHRRRRKTISSGL